MVFKLQIPVFVRLLRYVSPVYSLTCNGCDIPFHFYKNFKRMTNLLLVTLVSGKWYLQKSNLCFGIKSSEYDVFTASHTGSLCSLRLEHVSGKVWCSGSHSSIWGCPYFLNNRLMVIITDKRNNVIYPKVNLLKSNGWGYIVNGYTEYSPVIDLGFQNGGDYDVTKGTELRVWHAEDLYNGNESNNKGKTCAKVYAKFNC